MQERVRKPAKSRKKKLDVAVSIDATLAAAAAAQGIDLATALEETLRDRLIGAGNQALSEDDRAAIDFHNRLEAEHGRWTDGLEKL